MARKENMGSNAPAKQYKTLWRPDGEPMCVDLSDPLQGNKRLKDLLDRGFTTTKPAKTAAELRAASVEKEAPKASAK